MSNIMMCRVCLSVEGRKYTMLNNPLQEIYEKITNIPLIASDSKPIAACYICTAQLKKCSALMIRAQKADEILNHLVHNGVMLTQAPYIDLSSYNLAHKYTFTQTECVDIPEETILKEENNIDKTETAEIEFVKEEVKSEERLKPTSKLDEAEIERDSDQFPAVDNQLSDSEDDVPLKNIKLRKRRDVKKKVRVRKEKEEDGFIADFAKEIILSKEQQLQELLDRSKSLNYVNSPLKCEFCYKGFVDTRAYDNHKVKHDEKSGPYECDICHMRYSTQRQLKTHAMTSHSRRYECTKCSHRTHTANQAREHEKWHRGYTYECKLCGHTFKKPTSYLTHRRKRHPSQYVCRLCGDSFIGRHGLRMHRTKAHKHHHSQILSTKSQPPENPMETAVERFCGECNIQFATMEAWRRHVLTSLNHQLGDQNSLECKICSAQFPFPSALSAHMKEHTRALTSRATLPRTGSALAACDQCGSRFVNRSKLQAHIKRIHLGMKYNKNIVCEVCGKKCTSNASLKYHQRTHTGEKPYQCATCSKRFTDTNQLTIHTRTHTGERPYCCGVCDKRFSQKPALNRHYRVHTGAKPYTCTYCSKTFSQSNSLKLHISSVHLKIPPNRRQKQHNADVSEQNVLTLQTSNTTA